MSVVSAIKLRIMKIKNVAMLIGDCVLNNKDDDLLTSKLTSLLQNEEKINMFDIVELFNSIKNIINACTLINDCDRTVLDFHTNMNVVNNVTILMFKNNFNKKITALNERTWCNVVH